MAPPLIALLSRVLLVTFATVAAAAAQEQVRVDASGAAVVTPKKKAGLAPGPLHMAVASGRIEAVRAELANGHADDAAHRQGATPLHLAAQCGRASRARASRAGSSSGPSRPSGVKLGRPSSLSLSRARGTAARTSRARCSNSTRATPARRGRRPTPTRARSPTARRRSTTRRATASTASSRYACGSSL